MCRAVYCVDIAAGCRVPGDEQIVPDTETRADRRDFRHLPRYCGPTVSREEWRLPTCWEYYIGWLPDW